MDVEKFYVVVRKDIGGFGHQTSQVAHAAIDYCMTFCPKRWWELSNTIVTLVVDSEQDIFALGKRAMLAGVKHSIFCEPNFNYQATSIALEPGDKSKALCKGLKLVGKETSDWIPDDSRKSLIVLQEKHQQTPDQTIMQHGYSVNRCIMDLMQYLSTGVVGRYNWAGQLPEVMTLFGKEIVNNSHSLQRIWDYTLFHDCGKPICAEIIDGQYRFPDHARVSAKVARFKGVDEMICRLIEHDMDLHTLKAEDMPEFISKMYVEDVLTLCLSAFASLMSNAMEHGGLDSESYKIKRKKLTSRVKLDRKSVV